MQCITKGRNKTVTLTTLILLAKGFGMSPAEFLDDGSFTSDRIETEQ